MSEKKEAFYSAMLEVQKELHHAKFDSKNSHFSSEYASLESYLDAAKPVLSKHGFVLTQGCVPIGDISGLETLIVHTSGSEVRHTVPLLLAKQDMQALGSAITYARRYGLATILGMGSADDDGNGATQSAPEGFKVAPPRTTYVPTDEKPAAKRPLMNHAVTIDEPDWTPYKKGISDLDPKFFVMPFGQKFKGKELGACDPRDLESFAKWMLTQARADKKPMSEKSTQNYCMIMAYLDQLKSDEPPMPTSEDELPF